MNGFFLCLLFLGASMTFNSCTERLENGIDSEKSVNEIDTKTLSSNLKKSFKSMARSIDGRIIYPEYYGGCYLNKNNKLVILVSGNNINVYKKDLIKRCGGDGFEIKTCSFSYNYLMGLIYSLEEKWKAADPHNMMKYYGICTDQEKNKLVINTGDVSDANKNKFIDLLDGFENIEFVLSDEMELQAEVTPGMGIAGAKVTDSSGQSGYSAGSAGYRAKKGLTEVLVTSGHVLKAKDTIDLLVETVVLYAILLIKKSSEYIKALYPKMVRIELSLFLRNK